MRAARLFTVTALAMLAFAGNSLLCRLALKHTPIDAASFTTLRLVSGAVVLWLIVRMRRGTTTAAGNWRSALALCACAAGFSFAYVNLPASIGALLAERVPGSELTGRELEVLRLLARGQSNREIGDHLGIAENTVRIHVSRILDKLGVADRTQAAILAIRAGLEEGGKSR